MATEPYWLHRDSKEVANYLQEYHANWAIWYNSPFKQAWVRNFIAYYSPVLMPGAWDTSMIFEGIQGELTRFYTPKARTLIRQLIAVVTKQRLSFQASAMTSGTEVINDVKLANALSDQIVQNETLDVKAEQLTEGALVCGKWFMYTKWRTDRGQPYTRGENGALIYTGGVEITTPGVFDVYYDISYPHWDHVPWAEVRTIQNRFNLMAQHPELADSIMQLPSVSQDRGPNTWFNRSKIDDDNVYVYEFYARPCPALPKGRMLMYADDKCVFHDGDNVYETIPIEPMTPENVLTTGLGYPQFTNIMAAQEMFDNSLSAIATNQAQFAVQSVSIPRGSGVSVEELNGMRFVSFTPQQVPGGGRPEALQLTQSSPETFKFSEMLDKLMVDLSGINNALRGDPPPGVTSGVAIATLSANAMEFLKSVERPLQICMEKSMMHAINCYKKFAKLPQSLTMKGKNNQVSNKQFVGKHIDAVSGIKILTANPLMNTISGRIEIAEKMLGMPKDMWGPYIAILEGRPLQELTKSELSQEDLISSEDDMMKDGQQVAALATDDHPKHVISHASLLNNPEIRNNAPYVQTILDHIQQHMDLAQNTSPLLTALVRTGKMPEGGLPPPPQPQGAPPPNGGPQAEPELHVANPAHDALQRGAA